MKIVTTIAFNTIQIKRPFGLARVYVCLWFDMKFAVKLVIPSIWLRWYAISVALDCFYRMLFQCKCTLKSKLFPLCIDFDFHDSHFNIHGEFGLNFILDAFSLQQFEWNVRLLSTLSKCWQFSNQTFVYLLIFFTCFNRVVLSEFFEIILLECDEFSIVRPNKEEFCWSFANNHSDEYKPIINIHFDRVMRIFGL